jgi:hypothetical protein
LWQEQDRSEDSEDTRLETLRAVHNADRNIQIERD